MLGQVDLSAARCFAEFIDNSLDEGIQGTPGRGHSSDGGETLVIEIQPPTIHEYKDDYENAEVVVRDNGPGMSKEALRNNLRAGYSGKDPLDEMGLFGMGFNIATARLGNRTKVRTTRTGDDNWAVATIDFRKLKGQGSFEVDVEYEEKIDSSDHGTEIRIGRLNEMARTLRRKWKMPEKLGDWYTPVLERENVKIVLNNDELSPRPACTWSEERSVEIGGEEYPAMEQIEEKVGEGFYCKECWSWLADPFIGGELPDEPECMVCNDGGDVVHREQVVWGWVGIQRFFDEERFGIDLIRNGRVIEKHDKSLFKWENSNGVMEREYPLDTLHWGGRIVGELHIDFVPVSNTKDSFEKSNPRWEKVRKAVRGEAPLRPNRDDSFAPNRSPIGKLYKGYRTGNEVGKKRLVPGEVDEDGNVTGDNSRPKEWAEKFWDGEDEYQDDSKWWELVERAERAMRSSSGTAPTTGSGGETDSAGDDGGGGDSSGGSSGPGFNIDPSADTTGDGVTGGETTTTEPETGTDSDGGATDDAGVGDGVETEPEYERDESLSGKYGLDDIDQPDIEFNVYRLIDGELEDGPVDVARDSYDERTIRYDPGDQFFTEFGHDPITTVLMEAAYTYRHQMDNPGHWRHTHLFAELQAKYCSDSRVSPEGLASRAQDQLRHIKHRIADEEFELQDFDVDSDVEDDVRENIWLKENLGEEAVEEVLASSAYLEYASHRELVRYFEAHPEQFFDGAVWQQSYAKLGTDKLKERSVDKFRAYLSDVIMLAEEATEVDPATARAARRIEVDRAAQSLRLLEAEATGSS
ncbi:ATP-binding protein [Natronobiforma cellulositropha]|uniref:ATP-binding protein n=1 Tax=Natronobiforma cellulositropha TaxID=1679076 RepID=UPI0021D5B366|nr:ATP-binding protein [Natronobiforma cellulositropha]